MGNAGARAIFAIKAGDARAHSLSAKSQAQRLKPKVSNPKSQTQSLRPKILSLVIASLLVIFGWDYIDGTSKAACLSGKVRY